MTMHLLRHDTLLHVIQNAWNTLWKTDVGGKSLRQLHVDAQVIGKLFQELMHWELHAADPTTWQHPDAPRKRGDPDFVCTKDPLQSFELKMCGQPGSTRVFGNRCSSHGFASKHGKSRDCWLLTINYTDERINLVRFGHVLGSDWVGQASASGNAARLKNEVYDTKLEVVRGEYQTQADPRILKGLGHKTAFSTVQEAADAGVQEAVAFLTARYY